MAAVAATTVAPADAVVRKRRPSALSWLVFAPLLGWLIAFVVVPTVMLVILSLGEQKGLGTFHFTLTFDNYTRALNWTWLKVLLVSVWYAVLTTFFCVLIGYPVAFFVAGTRPRTRSILLTLVMIPFWTSFLIRTYSWITILSKDGLVSAFLVSAKILPEPVAILYTPFASVLGLIYNYLPFMILPIYASVERLDDAMIEAAYDLGAGPVRAFLQVIIPLTMPGIVAGVLLVFVPSIAMFAITSLMGGGEPPTIGEVIYKQFTSGRNQPFGAALGCLLLLIFFASLWMTRTRREE